MGKGHSLCPRHDRAVQGKYSSGWCAFESLDTYIRNFNHEKYFQFSSTNPTQ